MMTGVTLAGKAVGCEEEEGEEGYVNLAKGEHSFENNNGWRTPDDSLLELEAADDIMHVYHVNIIMEEDDSMEEDRAAH
jgi:hypothetical protein